MKTQRVWIVRTPDTIYALLAVCTHLGCTPRWLAPENDPQAFVSHRAGA